MTVSTGVFVNIIIILKSDVTRFLSTIFCRILTFGEANHFLQLQYSISENILLIVLFDMTALTRYSVLVNF